jgi:hypothetical protein
VRRWYSETLASRKVVYREVCTEGSETAKSGTDEQKLDMRHSKSDEVAQHTKVPTQKVKYLLCRFSRHQMKEKALTGGGLGIDSFSMSQEVSRGHSSYLNTSHNRYVEVSQR